MPKLSNMVGETGTIEIPVSNDEPLIVSYRRGRQSPRRQIKILTAQREMAQFKEGEAPDPALLLTLVEMLGELLVSWNLTDNEHKPIGTDVEALLDVDLDILTAVMAEIGRQSSADPLSGSGSSNGSSLAESSGSLLTISGS